MNHKILKTQKLMIIAIILLVFGCNPGNSKSAIKELNNLKNTKWIHQPFQDISSCIDTLFLINNQYGYIYSCEHEMKDSITFQVLNDTLFMDIYDYLSEVDLSGGLQIVSKYKFVKTNGNLYLTDIKHRCGDKFESVDKKFLGRNVYKKFK
ncbi:MAG: hypothetical protein ABI207_03085 [Crocinitomicaceae bacterium]